MAEGTGEAVSIAGYFNTMLDQSMDWNTAADIRAQWGGTFCLKGVMSAADARRAVEIGADGDVLGDGLLAGETAFDRLVAHMAPYSPEWAASICDVSAATMRGRKKHGKSSVTTAQARSPRAASSPLPAPASGST